MCISCLVFFFFLWVWPLSSGISILTIVRYTISHSASWKPSLNDIMWNVSHSSHTDSWQRSKDLSGLFRMTNTSDLSRINDANSTSSFITFREINYTIRKNTSSVHSGFTMLSIQCGLLGFFFLVLSVNVSGCARPSSAGFFFFGFLNKQRLSGIELALGCAYKKMPM